MKQLLLFILAVCMLGCWAPPLSAQKQNDIIIDKDLEAHSKPLKIKLGTQTFSKMAKYKFGDYAVVEGKVGWTTTTGGSNLFETKAESQTKNKFSFIMADKTSNTATLNAAYNLKIKAKMEQEVFPLFYVGEDELLLSEENFTAALFLNKDTSNLWLLVMKKSFGTQSEDPGGAFLTSRERKILIVSASSNMPNAVQQRMLPARGYQFMEGETVLSAMQYLGAGALGMNKCYVWLRDELDSETKLVLSAAMTALLHKELSEMDGMNSPDIFDDE
ncbi:hypothetical protein [Maribellus sediminis]|uniref:hypothetical protein n=1 Tax=Maribellus sediminis TaxID=2696285 RepID=UPI00142FBB27|nr:hypothetical protein [Maribellus sediminis]